MKKKVLSTLLVAALTASLFAGCTTSTTTKAPSGDNNGTTAGDDASGDEGNGDLARPTTDDYGSGEIKIWVADNVVDLTKEYAEKFLASDPAYSGYTVVVEPVGEGDAAGNMITDVKGGADIFGFAQDQLVRLVAVGALTGLADTYYEQYIEQNNDKYAVGASKAGDELYAFPVTSDNGYFMFYDKSVITDPTSLEKVVADCEAAGKNLYFEINNGWYQPAFFFATGANLTYETDEEGNFSACNIGYNTDKGLVALKEIIELASSPSFQNGSAVDSALDAAVVVSGTWNVKAAKELFGDNYATAKLPSFEGSDGETYQLSGFGGFKLLGVKPQEDPGKALVCLNLAEYLSSAEVQIARYEAQGWGPSNLEAQQNEKVQQDEALQSLSAQLTHTIPQGQYPGDYWTRATALGDDIIAGNYTVDSTDDDLMKVLAQFEADCKSYAGQ